MDRAEPLLCEDLVEFVTDYLEGALGEPERARFEEHLEVCEGCRAYLNQMRRTIGLSGRFPKGSVPRETCDRLLELFRDWKAS